MLRTRTLLHPPVPELLLGDASTALQRPSAPAGPVDEALVRAARPEVLPAELVSAVENFRRDPGSAGALLVHGLPTGELPPTPAHPASETGKDRTSELLLLAVANLLGEPVGYLPEHGGALVQNLVPVAATAHTQMSTSSAVDLEFHTETAFHPHRPRYLLLTCLRGQQGARTYLCSLDAVLDALTDDQRSVLGQDRFRTRVDESFGGGRELPPLPPAPVLRGDPAQPALVFDADLMEGTDPEAQAALDALGALALELRVSVELAPGDLLAVDNHRCIHGRSAFTARYDGTDRWLQRAFVVEDLAPSAADRRGRIIQTAFV